MAAEKETLTRQVRHRIAFSIASDSPSFPLHLGARDSALCFESPQGPVLVSTVRKRESLMALVCISFKSNSPHAHTHIHTLTRSLLASFSSSPSPSISHCHPTPFLFVPSAPTGCRFGRQADRRAGACDRVARSPPPRARRPLQGTGGTGMCNFQHHSQVHYGCMQQFIFSIRSKSHEKSMKHESTKRFSTVFSQVKRVSSSFLITVSDITRSIFCVIRRVAPSRSHKLNHLITRSSYV